MLLGVLAESIELALGARSRAADMLTASKGQFIVPKIFRDGD